MDKENCCIIPTDTLIVCEFIRYLEEYKEKHGDSKIDIYVPWFNLFTEELEPVNAEIVKFNIDDCSMYFK